MTATSDTHLAAEPASARLARLREHYATSDQSESIDEALLETDVDPDPMVTTSLRLPRSLLQWVRAEAEQEHVRPTTLMRRWLEERQEASPTDRGSDRLAALEGQVGELVTAVRYLAEVHPPSIGRDLGEPTTMATAQVGTLAKTGEVCPESGVWAVVGTPTTTAPIAKGNRMPPFDGQAVSWQLQSVPRAIDVEAR